MRKDSADEGKENRERGNTFEMSLGDYLDYMTLLMCRIARNKISDMDSIFL